MIKEFLKEKIARKNYYKSNEFCLNIENLTSKITEVCFISNTNEIKTINAIFENHRNEIFYMKYRYYGLIYNNIVYYKVYRPEGLIYLAYPATNGFINISFG